MFFLPAPVHVLIREREEELCAPSRRASGAVIDGTVVWSDTTCDRAIKLMADRKLAELRAHARFLESLLPRERELARLAFPQWFGVRDRARRVQELYRMGFGESEVAVVDELRRLVHLHRRACARAEEV